MPFGFCKAGRPVAAEPCGDEGESPGEFRSQVRGPGEVPAVGLAKEAAERGAGEVVGFLPLRDQVMHGQVACLVQRLADFEFFKVQWRDAGDRRGGAAVVEKPFLL